MLSAFYPDQNVPETDYNFTVAIDGDYNYINNQNKDSAKVVINIDKAIEESTGKTVKILITDSKGTTKEVTSYTIPAHMLQADISTVQTTDGNKTIPTVLEGLADGEITFQLIEKVNGKDVVVGKTVIVKNTEEPLAAKVSTKRDGSKNAKMSLENVGAGDLVKMYYTIVPLKDTGEIDDTSGASEPDDYAKLTKSITITNNKLVDALISDELVAGKAYKVYYVLENSYGSRTVKKGATPYFPSEVIAKETSDVTDEEAVAKITVPDLTKTATAEFKWQFAEDSEVDVTSEDKTYSVVLYKDGKAVATKTVTVAHSADAANNMKNDFATEIKENGEGDYTVGVTVKGDTKGTSRDSKEVVSEKVTVTRLKPVSEIVFGANTDADSGTKPYLLSWNPVNDVANISDYTINLYELKEDGTWDAPKSVTTSGALVDNKAVKLSTTDIAKKNTIYKAEITAKASASQLAILDSEIATSNGFYVIDSGTTKVENVTSNSATITGVKEIVIGGKTATYQVEICTVNPKHKPTEPEMTTVKTIPVTVKDGVIVIEGLDSETQYAFKLIATVDGVAYEADYMKQDKDSNDIITKITTPEVNKLKVVDTVDAAKVAGTIYYSGSTIYVNGKEIKTTDNYEAEFLNKLKIVEKLNKDDVVTISENKVTLVVDSAGSDETDGTELDFAKTAKDLTIEIYGNKNSKTVKADSDSKPSEVILNVAEGKTEALFDVSSLNAKKITLNDKVEVTGDQEYTVSKNATVIVNGIKVNTEKELVLNASEKTLNVTVNKDDNNNLTFENLYKDNYEKDTAAVINLVGSSNSASYIGTITIKSVGGSVEVTQTNVDTDKTVLSVNVQDATVDMTKGDETFGGDVTVDVTVSENKESETTLTLISKVASPIAIASSVELKAYTREELLKETKPITGVDATNVDDVLTFINSLLGENNVVSGAKIKVEANSNDGGKYNKVTITFTEATTGTIEGLQ